MKFIITKQDFLAALQKVYSVATSKTMAILSTILLEAKDGTLTVSATDLDLSLVYKLDTKIIEEGALAIPAKRLVDIIRSLPDCEINVASTKNNNLTINTPSCNFRINSLPAEDFPKIPKIESNSEISLKQSVLKNMINLTSFSVSKDETRYTLNGILFNVTACILTLVSTDGKRLSVVRHDIATAPKEEINTIISLKAILEIDKSLNNDTEIKLSFSKNQMLCSIGNLSIMSRLIEGEFPNWKQVIPEVSKNRVYVDRKLFMDAANRASLLVTENYAALKLSVFKDKVIISKETPDVGEMKEEVSASYAGTDTNIGFNPAYLIDVLKALNDSKIELELTGADRPGVIRSGDYIHVLLPMRIE